MLGEVVVGWEGSWLVNIYAHRSYIEVYRFIQQGKKNRQNVFPSEITLTIFISKIHILLNIIIITTSNNNLLLLSLTY